MMLIYGLYAAFGLFLASLVFFVVAQFHGARKRQPGESPFAFINDANNFTPSGKLWRQAYFGCFWGAGSCLIIAVLLTEMLK